jgi:hypothetical protein
MNILKPPSKMAVRKDLAGAARAIVNAKLLLTYDDYRSYNYNVRRAIHSLMRALLVEETSAPRVAQREFEVEATCGCTMVVYFEAEVGRDSIACEHGRLVVVAVRELVS